MNVLQWGEREEEREKGGGEIEIQTEIQIYR